MKISIYLNMGQIHSFKDLVRLAPKELQHVFWQQWKAPQNPQYHPEGNTLKHIAVVVTRAIRQYPDDIDMILAAFFHDLGKFFTLDYKNNIPTAYKHEEVSVEFVDKFANWITSLGGDVERIKYIVENHMKIKPNVWDVMKQKKKDIITQHPAYDKLNKFGGIDKGGLKETIIRIINEEILLLERKSHFEILKNNKVPLSDDERKEVMDSDATWNSGINGKPSPAVWKSVDKKNKKITYVTNTHRAYNTASTLKGAISRYHKFIKGTA